MARNANTPPSWPETRNIDGYDYARHGVYATREQADKAVAEVRATGTAAQAFSSTYPKVTGETHNGLFLAGCAVVYTRQGDSKAPTKTATKKGTKKTAPKNGPRTVKTKSGARVRATPKGQA